MFEQHDDILTTKEVCSILKIEKATLYKLINQGELIAFRSGKGWRIPKPALNNYVSEGSGVEF